jgi:peptidoglycan hydrolase CwlO-like protein
MATVSADDKLTLKKLQNHVIKTILGAFALAVVGASLTSYAFYHNTTYNLKELNDNKDETKNDIKVLKQDVNDIKVSLSNTGIYTTDNKEKIDILNEDIKEIKRSQEEMMKLLISISNKR